MRLSFKSEKPKAKSTAKPAVDTGVCLIAMVPKTGLQKGKASSHLFRLSENAMKEKLFKGEKNTSLFLPYTRVGKSTHLLFIGLGDTKNLTHEIFRQASATAYRQLEKHAIAEAEVDLSLCNGLLKEPTELIRALTEGFSLAHYHFKELKKPPKDGATKPVKNVSFSGVAPTPALKVALEEAKTVADSVNFARRLADTPANLMTPAILAREVEQKFRGIKNVRVSVWNKERIKKEKMGGLLGVSLGSSQEPRMIMIEYKGLPDTSKKTKPLCFVGKGLTFDAGGISIKPARNMDEMKFDMCGSIAVIGALLAIARLKLKNNVLGLVGSTENMLGASATKPGDVLTARNGKTMEVLNTDAEGRLVLADVLSYACEQKPEFIVDAATLTGAVTVSLSDVYTGLFTKNQELGEKVKQASARAGERMWQLPLDDFHTEDIKSPVADVANISSFPGGGSSTAAAFLEHFVDKNIPWAHLDIAGTAYNVPKRLPYCRPKSASGVMVRTFVELARQYIR